MNKPLLIGVSANREFADFPHSTGLDRTYINSAYINALYRVGTIPVIIPILEDKDALACIVDQLDGVVLSGGSDVSPLRYGQQPIPQCGAIDPLVDAFNLALVETTLQRNKPLFGICRGMQIINVALGGTLIQDTTSQITHSIKHDQQTIPYAPTHEITIEPTGFLYPVYGSTTFVNSLHHQSLDRLGNGLFIAAKSSDGVIEAMQSQTQSIYAVQWHPELMADHDDPNGLKFFKWMVDTIQMHG